VNASKSTTDAFDLAVVGAGIVGLAVARELHTRHPDLSLVILDQEDTVARHQTGHNSGVIHSGVYYKPGSLKARLCTEGSRMMYEYCDTHAIKYERCGKLIIALEQRELPALADIEHRGHANGVPGLRRIDAAQIPDIEPGARGLAALHCPSTGIVDFGQVARTLERELRDHGTAFRLGHRVHRLERSGTDTTGTTTLITDHHSLRARFVIACAGLWSDRLAVAAGAPRDPRIIPFRGAYLTLAPTPTPLVHTLIYPVPDPDLPFLGVHVTRHINGQIMLGPTALMTAARDGYHLTRIRPRDLWQTATWPGTWRMAARFWKTGLNEIRMAADRHRLQTAAARYIPAIADAPLETHSHGGVRAQALARNGTLIDDFVIGETPGAIHIRNAPSPAATSSLALAREIADRLHTSPQWPWPTPSQQS
jgi:(S)-2-hydroxyglutarate dehydrogenase